ncbi:amidohydrolase family protein [Paraburkholderia sp. RL18-101-BIB-B]|uniref:amidohydrolase family protein n=1 Tax=unclassified Paraburkholderia TaxID=2615204 RepID=UPI0038BB6D2A
MPVPFSAGTGAPRLNVPPLACDCHMHVYSDRYAVADDAVLLPPDASLADYRKLQRRLGTTRNVFVLPSTYGVDNASVLDAIAASNGEARGIGVADRSLTLSSLEKLDRGGMVGLRFNLARAGANALTDATLLAPALAERGWHAEFHVSGLSLADIAPTLAGLPCDVVLDHMARMPFNEGTVQPAFRLLRELLDGDAFWVKLSGTYLDTQASVGNVVEFGKALVEHRPDRLVWGSDWPHPAAKAIPDDAGQLDYLLDWAPDAATRNSILVDNPARLYRF